MHIYWHGSVWSLLFRTAKGSVAVRNFGSNNLIGNTLSAMLEIARNREGIFYICSPPAFTNDRGSQNDG